MGTKELKKIDFLDLIIILAERKKLLLISLPLLAVVAVIISLLLPKVYQARAVIIPPKQQMPSVIGNLLGGLPTNNLLSALNVGTNSDLDLLISILESRRLTNAAIEHFNLVTYWGFHKKKKYAIEDVEKVFWEHVKIREDGFDNIVIAVEDTSPEMAASMANYFVDLLNEINYDISKEAAQYSRTFFESRLKEVQNQLDNAHKKMADFQIENSYLDLESQLSSTIEALSKLEAQTIAVDMEIDLQTTKFGVSSPIVKELNSKKTSMRRKIKQYYEDGNGDVLIALKKAPEKAIKYTYLYRDVKTQEVLYSYILQLYEQAKFQEINNIPQARVLERAQIPQRKIKPKRSVVCTLIFFIGFVAICGYILSSKWLKVQAMLKTPFYEKLQELKQHLIRANH